MMEFSREVPVYRIVVNAPCSQGAAGFATHLPPTFMIGTGFAGRSSIGENVGPQHLVHWTRIAFGRDVPADLGGIELSPAGTPVANIVSPMAVQKKPTQSVDRDELRQLILDELRSLKEGSS